MTHQEKAKELYHKFLTCQPDMYLAKQSTYIAVDEIIKEIKELDKEACNYFEYWQSVKQEIKKL